MGMSATAKGTPAIGLSDDELEQMLALAGGADSVELKLTVPDAHHRSTIIALGMDPLDAQIRLVSFFDTPELALNQHGLVVGARRVKGREDDSVVKLRPVVPDERPGARRRARSTCVESAAMCGGDACAPPRRGRRTGAPGVKRGAAGERRISKL